MNRLQTLTKNRYEQAILHVKLTKNFNNLKLLSKNALYKETQYIQTLLIKVFTTLIFSTERYQCKPLDSQSSRIRRQCRSNKALTGLPKNLNEVC